MTQILTHPNVDGLTNAYSQVSSIKGAPPVIARSAACEASEIEVEHFPETIYPRFSVTPQPMPMMMHRLDRQFALCSSAT